ncbi:ATPase, T2SS/T4P/T4SS family [Nitratidesulfovibrio sp. 1201_IL3209]|uniref:CpaF family protein n=1 Tax=Nitratidesulfovibrio sp. 1201_IL3209 TaxID=3084053 RepID=UPI003FA57064
MRLAERLMRTTRRQPAPVPALTLDPVAPAAAHADATHAEGTHADADAYGRLQRELDGLDRDAAPAREPQAPRLGASGLNARSHLFPNGAAAAPGLPNLTDSSAGSDLSAPLSGTDGLDETGEAPIPRVPVNAATLFRAPRPEAAPVSEPAAAPAPRGEPRADASEAQGAQQAAETQSVQAAQPGKARPMARPSARPAHAEQVCDVTTLTLHGDHYYEIRARLQDRLLDMMDLAAAESLPPDRLAAEIARLVEKLLREEFRQAPLNAQEQRRIVEDIRDEVMGLGPLEPLLRDPTVNDILVNNHRMVYVERRGKLLKVNTRFLDDDHLRKIIDRIVARIGRRVDEASPMVDARLADGSRVNAIIPPLALDGPSLSIRRFSKDPLELEDLIRFGALTPEMGEVLRGIVKARLNIIVSGGTGSGKTTMLNCLSRFVPHDERIVTIEDAAELQLKQDHVVRLETRPANIEGHGEVTARDLVKNCLRMRPDRIIVGEVRSGEVLDMLQAMNTGHDGSLTTIHANSPRDCLMRLETMVAMAGLNIGTLSLKRYISSAVDVIIQVSRLADGSRKMTSLSELTGMEGEAITMQDIFTFEQTGVDGDGKVQGRFRSGGIRPRFAPRLAAMGIELGGALFDPSLSQ